MSLNTATIKATTYDTNGINQCLLYANDAGCIDLEKCGELRTSTIKLCKPPYFQKKLRISKLAKDCEA